MICVKTILWVAEQQSKHKHMKSASEFARKLAVSIGLHREYKWSSVVKEKHTAGERNLSQTIFVNGR